MSAALQSSATSGFSEGTDCIFPSFKGKIYQSIFLFCSYMARHKQHHRGPHAIEPFCKQLRICCGSRDSHCSVGGGECLPASAREAVLNLSRNWDYCVLQFSSWCCLQILLLFVYALYDVHEPDRNNGRYCKSSGENLKCNLLRPARSRCVILGKQPYLWMDYIAFYICFLKYQAFEENCGDVSFNPEMGIVLLANNNTEIWSGRCWHALALAT